MSIELDRLPTLRDDQRLAARQQARANLIAKLGNEPTFAEFERRQETRYSPQVERFWFSAMWALLIAAFVLSAIHIYSAAKAAYGAGIEDSTVQIIAGLMFVAVAEIAAILFSTAPAIYETSISPLARRLSYGAALIAGFVAIVGNVTVSIAYQGGAFDWVWAWIRSISTNPMLFLVATVPPIFVLIVGQIQKARLLALSERRHAAHLAYDRAMRQWDQTLARLENQPGWRDSYAWALWDTWRKGKRRDLVAQITPELRQALIVREMQADQFFADNTGQNTPPYDENTADNTAENTALERLKIHLADHPEDSALSFRKLADAAGVSVNTVQRYRESTGHNGHDRRW